MEDISLKLVNVIIPAYNCEKTVQKAVESIQLSGLRRCAILLVNDGSTDNTQSVCEQLAAKYNNVMCVHQKNAGVSSARNVGIERSEGEYLLFFDADDTVDSGTFTQACSILEERQPDMLIFGMAFDYYHKGKIYRTEEFCYPGEALYTRDEVQQYFSELYRHNALTSSCNKFIRRSVIMENRLRYPMDMFLLEDFLFTLDCLEKCNIIYTLPQAIYRYHQSEDEGNVYRRLERISSLTEFVSPFRARLKEHKDILSAVYFMLLRQKLWRANTRQIRLIAEDYLTADIEPGNDGDMELCDDLKSGRYGKIRFQNLKAQLRHWVAIRVKWLLRELRRVNDAD